MKRQLSNFELAIIGYCALSAGSYTAISGFKFAMLKAGLPIAIVAAVAGFSIGAYISSILMQAITLPLSIWFGKLLTQAEMN